MDDSSLQQLLKRQFPTLESMIYCNHAAISPWPRVTSEALQGFAGEICDVGPMRTASWLLREIKLKRRIAGLLGATSGDDVALLKNTSEGICTVANGIDWKAGDNIVMPAEEFVTNQMPWDELQSRGVEIRKVRITASDDAERDLLSAMDHRTRVLTVSSVQWDSGFRLDLKVLGYACSTAPALFFVDAIQHFGALGIDVEGCRIDALSAGAHKWQMGPEGMAVFYCNRETRRKLKLVQHGWKMLDDPYFFSRPARQTSETARRFEIGSPNTAGQSALFASLGLLEQVGVDRVQARVLANTRRLVAGFEDIEGLDLWGDTAVLRQSGIVSCVPKDGDPEGLRHRLSRMKVYVAVRGKAIRISPHFYQDSEVMDRFLNRLEDAVT